MPIYLNKLTFKLKNYSLRKGVLYLQKKSKIYNIEKVCIGNTIEILNNPKYNNYMMRSLKFKYGKSHGCEIEITNVEEISYHGQTNQKFN